MLNLLRNADGVALLVEKSDRLYRNLEDYVEVRKLGIEIHLPKEGVVHNLQEETSAQYLTQGLKSLIAGHSSINLREETRKGMRKKAELGIWPSVAPLGYLNERRTIVVDVIRAPIIRQWRVEGFA